MKTKERKLLISGVSFIIAFALWTWLIQIIDVKPAGVNGTEIGFATLNGWFHKFTGVHMWIYTITDWLGLVPVVFVLGFGFLGLIQWIKRKSITKVDFDILVLGVIYIMVIGAYLFFVLFPVNFRPVLIEGYLEASYPSSTTVLGLCVMPTAWMQLHRRIQNTVWKRLVSWGICLFMAFMVVSMPRSARIRVSSSSSKKASSASVKPPKRLDVIFFSLSKKPMCLLLT